MSKVKLYIAKTEDGFIARKNGSVDFLNNISMDDDATKRYESFLEGVDTIVMASNTYNQIITELSSDSWPYPGKTTYVFSNSITESKYKSVVFVSGPVTEILEEIKDKSKKDIWLLGGANIAQQFHFRKAIDEYIITTVPVNIREGIDLFSEGIDLSKLKKTSHKEYGDLKEDVYRP